MNRKNFMSEKQAAIGRIALLGEFYDSANDSFLGISALKSNLTTDDITPKLNYQSDIQFISTDKLSDKLKLFEVSGSLKLKMLAGLFVAKGSGKYLNKTKESSRSVTVSLMFNVLTKYDRLNLTADKLMNLDNLYSTGRATHIVVGIKYGCNTTLTLECDNLEKKEKTEIIGSLDLTLKKIKGCLDVSGKAQVENRDAKQEKEVKISFKFYGDIIPAGDFPQNVEDVCRFMQEIQKSMKNLEKEDKSKAIEYELASISDLLIHFGSPSKVERTILRIDETTVQSIAEFFDEMANIRGELNDMLHDMTSEKRLKRGGHRNVIFTEEELLSVENELKAIKNAEANYRDEIRQML